MPPSVLDLWPQSQRCELPRIRASQEPDKELVDVEAPLPGRAQHAGEDRLRFSPRDAAVATAGHFSIDHRRAYGLFGRPIGCFQFGVVEVTEDRLAVLDDVPSELAVLVVRELLGDQLVEAPFQFGGPPQELAASQTPFVPEISQLQTTLEKRFEVSRETHRATTGKLLEQAGPPDEMAVTELVDAVQQAVVGSPAISTELSSEVTAQGLLNDVEATARLDHVERGLFTKRHEGPQPLSDTCHLPAAFVGIDDSTVPDDDLDLVVQRHGFLGCAQERSQKRRAVHGEPEEVFEEPRNLAVRDAGGLVELNAKRNGVGSDQVGGGAKSIGRLQGVTPLGPTPTVLAALAVNAELDDLGFDRRDIRLILVVDRVALELPATVHAGAFRDWSVVGFVDFPRRRPEAALAVASATLASRLLGLLLRVALGEGSRLALLCLLRLLKPLAKLVVFPLEPRNLAILGSAVWAAKSVLPLAPPWLSRPASHARFIGGADKKLEAFPEESSSASATPEQLTPTRLLSCLDRSLDSTGQTGGNQIPCFFRFVFSTIVFQGVFPCLS